MLKYLVKRPLFFLIVATCLFLSCGSDDGSSPGSSPNANNFNSGSTSRFTRSDVFLYTLSDRNIVTYDITTDETRPVMWSKQDLARDVETIFIYSDKLLVGSSTGVYGIDISNPLSMRVQFKIEHIFSCDPVVAEGNYAYATLNGFINCTQGINRLDVLDISDFANTSLVKSYDMISPLGLAVRGDRLYVCDSGIKVFDNSNPLNISVIKYLSDVQCNDMILKDNLMYVTSSENFAIYDTSGDSMSLLSKF